MATKKQVIEAVRRHLGEVDDGLFTIRETKRVMGFVASRVFESLDHEERQQLLWSAIEADLPGDKTRNVGPLTAMTPDEARLHVEAAD